jgi:hypothetical protein
MEAASFNLALGFGGINWVSSGAARIWRSEEIRDKVNRRAQGGSSVERSNWKNGIVSLIHTSSLGAHPSTLRNE